MVFCSNCGKELTADAKFCSACGIAVNVINKNEKEQRKTIYDGDLHKCPKCGEHLNAFVTICPVCDYELRGTQTTSCVHELSLKLENTESDKQKIELIRNFYIPNTKEDIYEFFILAVSNITAGGYGIDAWTIKLEQAYLKAKLSFGNSKEFEYIDELYNEIKNDKRKKKNRVKKAGILTTLGPLMIALGILLFVLSDDFFIFMIPLTILGVILLSVGIFSFIAPDKKSK